MIIDVLTCTYIVSSRLHCHNYDFALEPYYYNRYAYLKCYYSERVAGMGRGKTCRFHSCCSFCLCMQDVVTGSFAIRKTLLHMTYCQAQ